eukprot:jgi/Botrbrau1/21648/Bobra.43_1s0049.1
MIPHLKCHGHVKETSRNHFVGDVLIIHETDLLSYLIWQGVTLHLINVSDSDFEIMDCLLRRLKSEGHPNRKPRILLSCMWVRRFQA